MIILRNFLPKIAILFLFVALYSSCTSTKKVPEDKQLLTKNIISINDTIIKNEKIESLLYQKKNSSILGYPLRLNLYNLAKENADSSYYAWLDRKPNRRKNLAKLLSEKQVDRLSQSFFVSGLSSFLKRTGEPPVIIDSKKADKSTSKLKSYYTYYKGFFDVEVKNKIDSAGHKKGKVTYTINTGKAYTLDTLSREIETPKLDSLYATIEKRSLLKKGDVFNLENFDNERARITNYFRNNGVYHFQVNNVGYDIYDTLNPHKTYKLNAITRIENRSVKKGDTIVKEPFKIFKISQVNIFTNGSKRNNITVNDSVNFRDYTIYSNGKLNYKPKALTDAVFINKGDLFSDDKRKLTSTAINNLKVFNFPTIEYVEDTINGKENLIANVYLVPRKKYSWSPYIDFTHSNIQDFGITGGMGFTFRNLFKGAEILEISGKGNIGSSQDLANPNNTFFNISEYGGTVKLSFPRIFFPLKTNSIIKKEMFPSTQINVGFAIQNNIGLDKQSLSGGINYNWSTTNNRNHYKFELIGINYVRNLNVANYFNVYENSYSRLNFIAETYNTNPDNVNTNGDLTQTGAINFMQEVLNNETSLNQNDDEFKSVSSIYERYLRLIEDNLIVSSSFTFNRSTKFGLTDRNYYNFRAKIESAGNLLSLIGGTVKKEDGTSASGNKTLFGIEYAQYIKGEVEYVKHWNLGKKNSFAMRTFGGIAIPYGNGSSIPFSRSYFAGGSNDNRGWQAYSLGPGKSGSLFDFNEANMKLGLSTEFRYNILGQLNGALFTDIGNIWNIFDNVKDTNYTFNGLESFKDLAVGSGIGFRYDFNYFIFRLDFGYKMYNPAKIEGDRWFKDVSLAKTVLNFGINYPF